jgi:hypothetical protein
MSLPVEMTSFIAERENNNIALTWETATEENNEGFEVERSIDGRNWEYVGFVAGQGNTLETSNYTFIDENPMTGVNYYRLKQVDYDGQFEYSDIVTVLFETNRPTLQIFPNPVDDKLNVINGTGFATIYNILGQPVKMFNINSEQFGINISDLAKGQYILSIPHNSGTVAAQRFSK